MTDLSPWRRHGRAIYCGDRYLGSMETDRLADVVCGCRNRLIEPGPDKNAEVRESAAEVVERACEWLPEDVATELRASTLQLLFFAAPS